MPGVPGLATNTPKRSTERRRRNADAAVVPTPVASLPVEAPPLEGEHHPLARGWYESLRHSGQSIYYEPSDWMAAQVVAGTLSKFLKKDNPSAVLFASIWSSMSELLTTEGARRRARMEVERLNPQVEKPANVTDYRARLTQGGRR